MPITLSRKIATIDIGSNSIVLLIADCFSDGTITFLDENYSRTALGREVKKNGILSDSAVEHAIGAVNELKQLAEDEGADEIIITATSAVRSAENRNRFLVKCYKNVGLYPQVLSGKEEARYTYLGAATGISTDRQIITIDVGGGSTEVSWGRGAEMAAGHSLDIGCVSLKETFGLAEGYVLHKRLGAIRYMNREFAKIAAPLNAWLDDGKHRVIATGGSITTFAGIKLELETYEREKINMMKCRRKDLSNILKNIAKMDVKSRRRVPGMILDRVYDLPAGMMIVNQFLRYFQFKRFVVSTSGLRTGIIRHYAEKYWGVSYHPPVQTEEAENNNE